MKVNGKTLVVTGGGNGMGRELVLLLLKKGARVAAVDVNAAALEETARLAGRVSDSLSLHVLDITDRAAVALLPDEIIRLHGSVDGIINNAGIIQPFVRLNDLGYPDIERVLNINFWGVMHMTKSFLPHLLKRPQAHIVNISSMGGFLPVPGQSLYGATKAAVKLLTEGLNAELRDSPVRVTVVFPGAIATNIATNSGLTMPASAAENSKKFNPLPAPRAAEIIVDGMEKDKYRVMVGSDSRFMDLLYRFNPVFAAGFIYKKMRNLLP